MNNDETITCARLAREAKAGVKDFMDACLSSQDQKRFVVAAQKLFTERWNEVLKLIEAIDNPSDVQSQSVNCSVYRLKYQRLIRSVAFELSKRRK